MAMMRAGKDYGVRVIKPFGQFSTGFVMFPSAIYRDALLKKGWVETVKPDEEKIAIKSNNLSKPTLKLR
jgi:hypothetical protein